MNWWHPRPVSKHCYLSATQPRLRSDDRHYDPERDFAHKQLQLHPHLAEATASLASLASAGGRQLQPVCVAGLQAADLGAVGWCWDSGRPLCY